MEPKPYRYRGICLGQVHGPVAHAECQAGGEVVLHIPPVPVIGGTDTLSGMQEVEVAISGETIKLGQFIKLANLVATGGEAKALIAEGAVTVNGEVDARRGGILQLGDLVCIGQDCARVAADEGEEDYFDEATANDDFDPEKWRNM